MTFDPAYAHQPQDGTYHYHADPIALRYVLGDHVDYNSSTRSYSESTNVPARRSPILAWVSDGYPLYGLYGYSDPKTRRAACGALTNSAGWRSRGR